ncbi:hypothetical protein VTL71DRAFT_15911 [Oculimacula yallundae]|uniref:Uncharacterized protein n=1 Tax=Oculimacula yallundae TaxID=86028 RepID=A0ABR4CD08_9HELO
MSSHRNGYSQLGTRDQGRQRPRTGFWSVWQTTRSNKIVWLTLLCWSIATTIVGFLLGRSITTLPTTARTFDAKSSVRKQEQLLHYNRTFGDKPSTESDRAWKDIFPAHGGFFPIVRPPLQRVTLTVFHQLHCLDGIRQNYWHLYRTLQTDAEDHQDQAKMHISHAHVRHCIDLLRQTLMCNADTTLETKRLESFNKSRGAETDQRREGRHYGRRRLAVLTCPIGNLRKGWYLVSYVHMDNLKHMRVVTAGV